MFGETIAKIVSKTKGPQILIQNNTTSVYSCIMNRGLSSFDHNKSSHTVGPGGTCMCGNSCMPVRAHKKILRIRIEYIV